MRRLTRKTKRGIIKIEKGEEEAPVGWILGHGKDSSFFSVSDVPTHCDLALSFEDWKLVLKLVI